LPCGGASVKWLAGQPQGIARTIHEEALTAQVKFDKALRVLVLLNLLMSIIGFLHEKLDDS
jgi:hypothetical protein